MSRIAIINCGYGNFGSLMRSLKEISPKSELLISQDYKEIMSSDFIILPGIGAFGEAMENLKKNGLTDLINEINLKNKIPFLGICLGFQLLSNGSEEFEWFNGLNIINGSCKKLNNAPYLPHVGWNHVTINSQSKLLKNISQTDLFYFDHSFGLESLDKSYCIASSFYGADFVSVIEKNNIMGVQFHPEISGFSGKKILKNFLDVTLS